MSDMTKVTEPDSTQVNADDFLAGPQTFTITGVKIRGGKEQPVEVSLQGTEKFFRPCKSSCRVMVHVWGPDSAQYVGKSLTLYCDPSVKWGGMSVGGIRISHMSDMTEPMTMALTASRGSKKPHTVRPLEVAQSRDWAAELVAASTLDELGAVWKACTDKKRYLEVKDGRKASLEVANAAS